jgi:crossover junction endodeoxyribonuclease RusA
VTLAEERTARVLALDVFVPGAPQPKGSTRSFVVGGRTTPVRAVTTADNKGPARAWAATVTDAAHQHWLGGPVADALAVQVEFVLPRRKGAPKRSTPAHTRKPDIDKLARCVLDAMTHVVYADDAQIDDLAASKREAEPGETPGARIRIYIRPTGK